jgi:cyclopentanol dehydrogenase
VNEVVSRFGKLDVLVNNAAINHVGTVEETTADDWDRVMEVNAKGAFLGTKAVIPFMRQAGGGSIINISSGAGLVGNRASTVYNASKAAVHILTKSTAIQYAREGIRANSVHPGATKSPILANTGTLDSRFGVSVDDRLDSAGPDALEETDRHYGNCFGISDYELLNRPMGRMAVPEEIGYGVVYLASDESTFMTGAQLVIDGGRQAG